MAGSHSAYTRKRREDERRFPIRLRLADIDVPYDMRGRTLDGMRRWLDDMAGRDGWAWYPDNQPGFEASIYLLRDPALVRVFLETFDLELAEPAAL